MSYRDKQIRFYNSKPWKDLRLSLLLGRGANCSRCGRTFIDTSYIIGHHTIELNDNNIDDVSVSLNPNNVELICLDCHNKEHKRFGYTQQVYLIYGSPLSGKTSLVRQMSSYGDLILDIDSLWKCISGQPRYTKPNNLKSNIFQLRDFLIDTIRTRNGKWYDAYVIGGYPLKLERDLLTSKLGAISIYVDATKEECLTRASDRPSKWIEYINSWWDRYEPDTPQG